MRVPAAASLLLALAPGCARPAPAPSPGAAAELFSARCAKCHGPTGAGVGEDTASFTPRPPSFADPAWQARAGDAWLAQIIVGGGQAVGRSAAMPPFPDLRGNPMLGYLIGHLRTLQPPPPGEPADGT